MKNITIKQMIERSNIPAKLIRATVAQFGGMESFKECAGDVTIHGISGGFHGFIYYTETCEFYAKNQKEIVEYASQVADELDEDFISFIRSFNCIDNDEDSGTIGKTLFGSRKQHDTQIANALAWFAGEEVARLFVSLKEGE